MIKIFKSKCWKIFDCSRAEAIKHIMEYLESKDYLDCDICWSQYVELYDSDLPDVTVFAAHYSGWDYTTGEKLYPVEIETGPKEVFKERLSNAYLKWENFLTELDPRKDYIII